MLSTSAKVSLPAGAAFAQGLALGIAANFRLPASAAPGAAAAINSQPTNGVGGGVTFNREALAVTASTVSVLGLAAAITGIALGPLGLAAVIASAALNALTDPAIQALIRKHLGIDIRKSLFGDPCEDAVSKLVLRVGSASLEACVAFALLALTRRIGIP